MLVKGFRCSAISAINANAVDPENVFDLSFLFPFFRGIVLSGHEGEKSGREA